MSNQTIIIIVAMVAIIALLAARRRRPRVTQMDRTIAREKRGEDQ
jgi:hypothetical protein